MPHQISGVIASTPDQRDYIYVPQTLSFPASFSRRQFVVEYEDQADQGSCVGNSVASTLETHGAHFGHAFDLSRQFIYNVGRHLENRLGESGMQARTAYKVLQKYGVPDESDYPYGVERDSNPAQSVYDLAALQKISRYEFVCIRNTIYGVLERQQKIDRIKAALLEGLIPSIAMGVTGSIMDMRGPWRNQEYRLAGPGNELIGGHMMYVIGWDDAAGKFEVVNSWGQAWGDFGIGGFPYAIVDQPWFESWVARDFMGLTVPEAPGIKLEYLNDFACGCRIVPEPHEIGRTVNVWIGAVVPRPLNPALSRVYLGVSLNSDSWTEQHGDVWPSAGQITLGYDNPVKVVKWMDLSNFRGAALYLAYGNSPLDWKLTRVAQL